LTLLSLTALSQAFPQHCGPGYQVWPADQKCYKLGTQGPCGDDQAFLPSFRGAECKSFEAEDPVVPPSTPSTTSTPSSTVQCGAGQALWPVDLQCYSKRTQGPCGDEEIFLRRDDVGLCCLLEDGSCPPSSNIIPSSSTNIIPSSSTNIIPSSRTEDKWSLPTTRAMTRKETACLTQGKVYWPRDGECYDLLERGPCEREEWLVVRGDDISCQARPCPCDPAAPELCEVELPETTGLTDTTGPSPSCQRCVVARAAAQDGHCQPGEELLVNPAGYGECGCQTEPPHLRWEEDGQCYPVTSQGPCSSNETLQLGEDGEATCKTSRCDEGEVEYEDGGDGVQCHQLGERGPCRDLEILGLHPETLQPRCETDSRVTRSPWYAIPKFRRGHVRVGALPSSRRQTSCRVDRQGRCQPVYRHPNSLRPVRRNPADYLKMLRYFRGR